MNEQDSGRVSDPTDKPNSRTATPQSALLRELKAHGKPPSLHNEWKRTEPRHEAQHLTRLELRLRDGQVFKTRLHNVSDNGICVICPKKVDLYETVLLRKLGDTGAYEHFKVIHVSSTVGGFKVGLLLESDRS